jgi:hypothetical protein
MSKRLVFLPIKLVFCCVAVVMFFSSCGKQESVKGAVGAASGAVVGSAMCGDRYKGTGAFIGSLIGHAIGSEIGKAEDKEEVLVQEKTREEASEFQAENRERRSRVTRWCSRCMKRASVLGARSCPDCGTRLICEHFCRRCCASFRPTLGYQYCPYCPVTVALKSR